MLLSDRILKQIKHLNGEISTVEWSGILLYKIVSGDVNDIDNFVLQAEYVYLMDIGSGAYTEYKFSDELLDMYDVIPESDPIEGSNLIIGHIHSHNSMKAFFSGTDEDELLSNSKNHNHYLSLIVNNEMEPVAKLAIFGKRKEEGTVKNYLKNKIGSFFCIETKKDSEKDIVYIFDVDIEFNNKFVCEDQYIIDRIKTLKEKKEQSASKVTYTPGYQRSFDFNSYDNDVKYGYGHEKSYKIQTAKPFGYNDIFLADIKEFAAAILMDYKLEKGDTLLQMIIRFQKDLNAQGEDVYENTMEYIIGVIDIPYLKGIISGIKNIKFEEVTNDLVKAFIMKLDENLPDSLVENFEIVDDLKLILEEIIESLTSEYSNV